MGLIVPGRDLSRSARFNGGYLRRVGLTGYHQLPGDPGDLVGQRHRGQLRRLALEQRNEPGRYSGLAPLSMPDHRCRTDHQHTA